MQIRLLPCLLAIARLCLAQQFPPYVQFQGNRSAPNRGISPDVRKALVQADTNPNASHTVSFSSPGGGDWNWTLQISNVGVPAISNSTPDAHVAYTTWHFSGTDEEAMTAERAESYPMCAYLMDINFPYNVSTRWDTDNSSCVPALGAKCESFISAARRTDDCDSQNAPSFFFNEDECAGMFSGGPGEYNGILTQGLPFDADNVTDGAWAYALTNAYEGSNQTAFQAAAERLRIMVLTGPYGSKAICNRVARTVEIGAEDESNSGDEQGNGDEQGGRPGGESEAADSPSGGGEEDAESGASSTYALHSVGIAVSVVVSGLITY